MIFLADNSANLYNLLGMSCKSTVSVLRYPNGFELLEHAKVQQPDLIIVGEYPTEKEEDKINFLISANAQLNQFSPVVSVSNNESDADLVLNHQAYSYIRISRFTPVQLNYVMCQISAQKQLRQQLKRLRQRKHLLVLGWVLMMMVVLVYLFA